MKVSRSSAGSATGRHVAALTLGRFTSLVAQAGLVIWLSSMVSASEAGFILVWLSVGSITAGVTDAGLNTKILLASGRGDNTSVRTLLGVASLATIIVVTLGFLASVVSVLIFRVPILEASIAVLCLFWGQVERLTDAGYMNLTGVGKVTKVGWSMALRRISVLALFPLLNLVFEPTVSFIVSLLVVSLGALVGVPLVLPTRSVLRNLNFGLLVRELRPLALQTWMGQVRALDVPLVGAIFGLGPAAPYAFGVRLANPLHILFGSLGNVVMGRNRIIHPKIMVRIATLSALFVALLLGGGPALGQFFGADAQALISWIGRGALTIMAAVVALTLAVCLNLLITGLLVMLKDFYFVSLATPAFVGTNLLLLWSLGALSHDLFLTVVCMTALAVAQGVVLGLRFRRKVDLSRLNEEAEAELEPRV